MTSRTTRSSAAQIVVGEIALSSAIQTGPQAFYRAVDKNCAFARKHTISTTAQSTRRGYLENQPSDRRSSHNGGVCAPEGGREAAAIGTTAAVPLPDVVGKWPAIPAWRLLYRRVAGSVRRLVEQSGAPVGRPRRHPPAPSNRLPSSRRRRRPAESLSPVAWPARGGPAPAGLLVRSRTSHPPTVFSEPAAARRRALAPRNRRPESVRPHGRRPEGEGTVGRVSARVQEGPDRRRQTRAPTQLVRSARQTAAGDGGRQPLAPHSACATRSAVLGGASCQGRQCASRRFSTSFRGLPAARSRLSHRRLPLLCPAPGCGRLRSGGNRRGVAAASFPAPP